MRDWLRVPAADAGQLVLVFRSIAVPVKAVLVIVMMWIGLATAITVDSYEGSVAADTVEVPGPRVVLSGAGAKVGKYVGQ